MNVWNKKAAEIMSPLKLAVLSLISVRQRFHPKRVQQLLLQNESQTMQFTEWCSCHGIVTIKWSNLLMSGVSVYWQWVKEREEPLDLILMAILLFCMTKIRMCLEPQQVQELIYLFSKLFSIYTGLDSREQICRLFSIKYFACCYWW